MWKTLLSVVFWLAASSSVYSQKIQSKTENTTDYLLPRDVIPFEYFLHITPFIVRNNFTYNGIVNITVNVHKTISKIVLHSNGLTIHDVSIVKVNNNNVSSNLRVKNVIKTEKYQFLNIILESSVSTGTKLKIKIAFTGKMEDDQAGLFRRSYKINNETRWIAATHLEPTNARKFFPCFDEPALKAIFHISVAVPKNYFAISNMPIQSTENNIYTFKETLPISTYLLELAVTDFDSLMQQDGKYWYRMSSNPALKPYLSYGFSVMIKAVEFFKNRLNEPYSLPKLDAIVVPGFLASMENWGAIVYRENFVIYDPKVTSIIDKGTIRNSITHEVSHQWFGDPITPDRWDYLWLNEAFGTYFESHAYEDALASWNLGAQFVVNDMQPSFAEDAVPSSDAITRRVFSPDEIQSMFNTMVYTKGASIVRMVEKLLGSKLFYSALHRYLSTKRLLTTPELLYAAFEEKMKCNNFALNESFARLINNWTLQSGFPVVFAEFDGDTVKLNQKRFLLQGSEDQNDERTWIIPLNWATSSNRNFNDTGKVIWLREKEESLTIKKARNDWVIFNLQLTGYYRVNYDKQMWNRIINALKSKEKHSIHEINRAAIIDDLYNFARADLLDYDMVLSASQYLREEYAYVPWRAAFEGLTYLKKRFADNETIYKHFKVYVSSLLELNYEKLGFNDIPNEKELDKHLRIYVLQWLCSMGYEDCVCKSVKSFEKLKNDNSYTIPVNQQSTVYCTISRIGSNDDWNYLWNKFRKSINPIEKLNILSTLSCSRNSMNLKRILSNTITSSGGVQKLDVGQVFLYVLSSSSIGTVTTMEFIRDNYERILNYTGDESVLVDILASFSDYLTTRSLLNKFNEYFQQNNTVFANVVETLNGVTESATFEMNWAEKNSPKIFNWLKKNYPV